MRVTVLKLVQYLSIYIDLKFLRAISRVYTDFVSYVSETICIHHHGLIRQALSIGGFPRTQATHTTCCTSIGTKGVVQTQFCATITPDPISVTMT